jgi:hypothetical protein
MEVWLKCEALSSNPSTAKKKKKKKMGACVKWYSICPACARPWVQSLAPEEEKKERRKGGRGKERGRKGGREGGGREGGKVVLSWDYI